MAKRNGMPRSVVAFTRRLKQVAGEALLQASLGQPTPFALDVAKAGGRTVPMSAPPNRGPSKNPFK